jgi:hypothetical protein
MEARAPRVQGDESGRQVVALGLAVALTVVVLDQLMVGRLSLFFDLCFITLCLALAVRAPRDDWFVAGLLPPVLMLAVFLLLALTAPHLIAKPDDGVVQAVVSGLAHHSTALLVGYALALATWWRRWTTAEATDAEPGAAAPAEPGAQDSKREGSPAPTLRTSG